MDLRCSANNRSWCLCHLLMLTELKKIKTIQSASLLYTKCTADDSRWRTKSSEDFSTLHQSIHDFFGVDKSHQHLQEIDRATASVLDAIDPYLVGMDQETIDQSTVFSSLFFNLGGEFDTHDFWPSWP